MNSNKTIFALMFVVFVVIFVRTSFAETQHVTRVLTGMYTNVENPKAPQIEFKGSGDLLLYNDTEVIAHGIYEVEEGTNTLLLKLGNGQAIRFKFEQNSLSSFSNPKTGTWKKQ